MYEDLLEEKISSEDVFKGHLLHVKKDKVKLPNGNYSYREWIHHPGAAAVLPITENGDIILVRQYRYPIGAVTLEVPAGKLDLAGEEPLHCAKRELAEETGYSAKNYTFLTKLATTVGFSDEYIYIYAATDLEYGEQHPDEDEFINVERMSLEKAISLIENGEICDAKSITAILLWARKMTRESI